MFFFWRADAVARSGGQSATAAWASIRDQVDPNREAIWIMEGLSFELLDVFDGQFGYGIAWSSDVYFTARSWAGKVQAKENALGVPKLFVGTTIPGNDDTRTGNPAAYIRDREGGNYFATTWDRYSCGG